MEHHPAADSFPMMNKKRYGELVEDIRSQGQLEPITICDGKILDGRNRYNACLELNIRPITREYDGDPWAYAWSLNGQRRDLVDEQRYLIWKYCHEQSEAFQAEKKRIQDEANRRRAEAQAGIPKEIAIERVRTECPKTYGEPGKAAKSAAAKVNKGAVARGDKLAKDRPDLAEKVRMGEMRPAEAHRQMKRDSVAEKATALPTEKYRVIYADPPWRYNDKCDSGAVQAGGVEKHYPSMSISELCSLPIKDLAEENAVLFMWTTSPLLEESFSIISAWGFKYKASFVWDKVKHNMGHYNSVRHEFLLVATRGSCTPDNVKLYDSVQSIERQKHSEKPKEFRQIIDTLYLHGKKIELFARGGSCDGWDVWGNESNG